MLGKQVYETTLLKIKEDSGKKSKYFGYLFYLRTCTLCGWFCNPCSVGTKLTSFHTSMNFTLCYWMSHRGPILVSQTFRIGCVDCSKLSGCRCGHFYWVWHVLLWFATVFVCIWMRFSVHGPARWWKTAILRDKLEQYWVWEQYQESLAAISGDW